VEDPQPAERRGGRGAESGDFAVCAKWGARTDDLIEDHRQIEDCIPEGQRGRRHRVILTVGGNDIASITQDGTAGVALDALWLETQMFVARMREAAEWFRVEGRFPNGVYVVFANLYEFTDATGDITSCPGAAVAGYEPWDDPAAQRAMVVWANEHYLSIAVDTASDMVLMLEQFCGHGFHNEDPASMCYRGPGTPRWFDDTCTHPNPDGHAATAQLFDQVIAE
jgi:hypothetical protein